ncbi:MAG: hypothetical protein KatS3mg110_0454 [Pirellulaceae bacterium]|nr:MAG: hypothetical protein KatS3mg110_0454 [Pirellulaceae bacterium]
MLQRLAIGILWVAGWMSVAGCGSTQGYPSVDAGSAVGRPGKCDSCGKPLACVGPENLFSFQGIQYTVCGPACAARLKEDIIYDRLQ